MGDVTVHIESRAHFSKANVVELIEEINKSIGDNIIIVDEPSDLKQYENLTIVETESIWQIIYDWIWWRISKWLN